MRFFNSIIMCLIIFLTSCNGDNELVEIVTQSDTQAPSVPSNLSSSNVTVTSVVLNWDVSTDNVGVTGYLVYQDGTEIAEVSGTTHSVTGLIASTTYSFTVSAIDAEDNESAQSAAVSVTTLTPSDTQAPSIPSNLSSSNVTVSSVVLNWNASTDNVGVTAYLVYQDGTEIAQVTGTTHSVTGLIASTTYSFTVSAIDAAGNESAQSSAASVTTSGSSTVSRVLVFTKTAGFNHRTEAESIAMVEQIGMSQNFDVVSDNDGSEFNTVANLNQYEIIFFANTSGETLNSSQRDNVQAYAAQGGNFISNHAASDGFAHSTASTVTGGGKGVWDWYSENVTGCSVQNNPNHTVADFPAIVSVENQNTEFTSSISFPWSDNEEWYYWEGGYLDNSFTELLRVSDTGSQTFDDPRMTAHYFERPDGGISFYSAMGHAPSKFSDSNFVQLMSNAFNVMLN